MDIRSIQVPPTVAKKKCDPRPPAKVVLYEKLVALFPDVELKGANMLYTSMNGNMYS